jgi:hypothetical protein
MGLIFKKFSEQKNSNDNPFVKIYNINDCEDYGSCRFYSELFEKFKNCNIHIPSGHSTAIDTTNFHYYWVNLLKEHSQKLTQIQLTN